MVDDDPFRACFNELERAELQAAGAEADDAELERAMERIRN